MCVAIEYVGLGVGLDEMLLGNLQTAASFIPCIVMSCLSAHFGSQDLWLDKKCGLVKYFIIHVYLVTW